MRPAPKPWPLVISRLVDASIQAAKDWGIRGRVRVNELEERGASYYAIVLLIPKSETVPSRVTR